MRLDGSGIVYYRVDMAKKIPNSEIQLLKREEVLERLGVSDSTLRREMQAGRLHKPLELGRAKRWRLSWVIEYLDRLEAE